MPVRSSCSMVCWRLRCLRQARKQPDCALVFDRPKLTVAQTEAIKTLKRVARVAPGKVGSKHYLSHRQQLQSGRHRRHIHYARGVKAKLPKFVFGAVRYKRSKLARRRINPASQKWYRSAAMGKYESDIGATRKRPAIKQTRDRARCIKTEFFS